MDRVVTSPTPFRPPGETKRTDSTACGVPAPFSERTAVHGPEERATAGSSTSPDPSAERQLRDALELLERERRLREELERANETKDRFIAVLAHDLRPPLHAILGWVQLLQREFLDATARSKAFEKIERNAALQATLIDELLDISRLGSDGPRFEQQKLDVAPVVRRAVAAMAASAASAGIELLVLEDDGASDLTVLGDPARLAQVLTHLLSNAVKATPAGGRIEVLLRRDGDDVRIAVRDTGRGIAPERVPRLFQLGAHASENPPSRHELAVGLYVVRRLVEIHRGAVRAESEGEGKGATLVVTLPAFEGALASGRPGVSSRP